VKTLAICLVIYFAAFAANEARACRLQTDCKPGSECVKPEGSVYGMCVGGLSPGNSNDRQPVESPRDPNGTVGNTCVFNTDCGPGSACVKNGLYGVCVRPR